MSPDDAVMQSLWGCLVADSTLNIIAADDFKRERSEPVDAQTMAQAAAIVDDVRIRGTAGLREAVSRFEGRDGDPLLIERAALKAAFCLLYTSPSPRDGLLSRMPSSA